MRAFFRSAAAIVAVLIAAGAAMADGHGVSKGNLTISDPFARASAGRAKAGAAFLTITNAGPTDRLIAARADVSEHVELHTHIMDGDVMRMRQVPNVEVVGGGETALAPGGLHIMLIGLNAPLMEGDSFPLTLIFERAGDVEIEVPVLTVGAQSPASMHMNNHGG